MITDFCKFFRAIDDDPLKKISGLTIRDIQNAREHIKNCDSCHVICERVASQSPPPKLSDNFGEN